MQLILAELERSVGEVPFDKVPVLLATLAAMTATVQMRLMMGGPALAVREGLVTAPDAGRYLSVEEVAERFRVTPRWVYRHKKQMPHSQPSRKMLLFPEAALQRWFARRN